MGFLGGNLSENDPKSISFCLLFFHVIQEALRIEYEKKTISTRAEGTAMYDTCLKLLSNIYIYIYNEKHVI